MKTSSQGHKPKKKIETKKKKNFFRLISPKAEFFYTDLESGYRNKSPTSAADTNNQEKPAYLLLLVSKRLRT